MMHYFGRDDINKRQRSFAFIATIFIDSWSEGNHLFKWRVIQSRFAGFRYASLVFSTIGLEEVAAVEELTCRHGRRRTFGLDGQK